MTRGETDREAVRILQRSLISVGAATLFHSTRDGEPDGHYGTETVMAVRQFQQSAADIDTSGKANGIAGRTFWAEMDRRAPRDLAMPPVPVETPSTTRSAVAPRLPTAEMMLREYRRFRHLDWPGHPCSKREITNQCGVRMSVALARCNIGIHLNSPHLSLVDPGGGRCRIDTPHSAYPEELMVHMSDFWQPEPYLTDPSRRPHTPWRDVMVRVQERPGIILFKDLQGDEDMPARRGGNGDHIDFWDGSWVMNDRLHYNAANERSRSQIRRGKRWFRQARQIFFIPLPRS